MIALGRIWGDRATVDLSRIAGSLGLFSGASASFQIIDRTCYASLSAPRARPQRGWRVCRAPSGGGVLLHGWIDNQKELQDSLGLACVDPAALYGAAVDRWGDDADRKIIGSYAAIAERPDGSLRLSRSPWSGPPLAFANDRHSAVVASVSRVLFAAGVPQKLKHDAIVGALTMQLASDTGSMFEGVRQVPHGAVVHLRPGDEKIVRWYDPLSLPKIHLASDREYVEAAEELLREACVKALAPSERPGIELSGGLDSMLLADHVLHVLPESRTLRSFTFHPLDGADLGGRDVEDDERHFVHDFVRSRPQIEPHFTDNRDTMFDSYARQMGEAAGKVMPGMVLLAPFFGTMQAAASEGCDWVFSAHYGNLNLSNEAPWAIPEFARQGRWSDVCALLEAKAKDKRPNWRKFWSYGIMPSLPAGLQSLYRRVRKPGGARTLLRNRLISIELPGTASDITSHGEFVGSRRQWLSENYFGLGLGAEMWLALEQVFGVRRRDVTAYRPLTEFCLGIPTDQHARDGVRRYLARRMLDGTTSEDHRMRPDFALHVPDWHARMSPRLDDLRRAVIAMADQPDLKDIVNVDFAMELIDNWPQDMPGHDEERYYDLQFFLPATLLISQYLDFVTGRNTG